MNEKMNAQEIIDEVTLEQDKKYDIKKIEDSLDKRIEEETKEIVSKLE